MSCIKIIDSIKLYIDAQDHSLPYFHAILPNMKNW